MPLALIFLWLIGSFVLWPYPDWFQRMGALGVALGIASFGLDMLLNAQHEQELSSLAYRNDSAILRVVSLNAELVSQLTEAVAAENRGDAYKDISSLGKEISTNSKQVAQKIEELSATLGNHQKRISSLEFRRELVTIIVATIQWGFGDVASEYCRGAIWC